MLVVSGKPIKQVAAELGVAHWTLRDWKKRYGAAPTPRTVTELEKENHGLRQELLRAQNQRDILKKLWASSPIPTTTLRTDESDGCRTYLKGSLRSL